MHAHAHMLPCDVPCPTTMKVPTTHLVQYISDMKLTHCSGERTSTNPVRGMNNGETKRIRRSSREEHEGDFVQQSNPGVCRRERREARRAHLELSLDGVGSRCPRRSCAYPHSLFLWTASASSTDNRYFCFLTSNSLDYYLEFFSSFCPYHHHFSSVPSPSLATSYASKKGKMA